MEARSVPIDTPAAEYRPWRLALSRVTRPEVNGQVGKWPRVRRRTTGHGDEKRGRDRVRGAWCESVAEAVASPQTRRALSPPLIHSAGTHQGKGDVEEIETAKLTTSRLSIV